MVMTRAKGEWTDACMHRWNCSVRTANRWQQAYRAEVGRSAETFEALNTFRNRKRKTHHDGRMKEHKFGLDAADVVTALGCGRYTAYQWLRKYVKVNKCNPSSLADLVDFADKKPDMPNIYKPEVERLAELLGIAGSTVHYWLRRYRREFGKMPDNDQEFIDWREEEWQRGVDKRTEELTKARDKRWGAGKLRPLSEKSVDRVAALQQKFLSGGLL